ncbi:Chemotaxis protein methyltransferase Cher2 [Lacunisphaera limnophila]|uniref:protein-glutamate O-methyltransferase n=1 Tax=Lacunisphaera limnophila TaxID=1838286 RepID=A0A1D8AXJ8_9BACT|nr:protein-glutamate O-methyltransferase CheR [Lacunisphaera limnophila]AOS45613.1 Chemotaxis protein methyltransferase Cher2 [Lacunisphaera limnophila]
MADFLTDVATPLSASNFRFVAELLQREAAISLEAGKEYLVETRLASLATRHNHASVNGLVEQIRSEQSFAHLVTPAIIDALTTNETLFFRDIHPFETLRKHVLPKLIAARAAEKKLTLWSAASSTGQEAYSLAMLLTEHFPQLQDWQVRIIGTDLSPTVVNKARRGIYSQIEVNRGLPASYLVKYFRQKSDGWHLADAIKAKVEFRELNLIRPWSFFSKFDLIFMRYVLIYFTVETKRQIMQNALKNLAPDGYFFLGGAESALTVTDIFTPVTHERTTCYQATPPKSAVGF